MACNGAADGLCDPDCADLEEEDPDCPTGFSFWKIIIALMLAAFLVTLGVIFWMKRNAVRENGEEPGKGAKREGKRTKKRKKDR